MLEKGDITTPVKGVYGFGEIVAVITDVNLERCKYNVRILKDLNCFSDTNSMELVYNIDELKLLRTRQSIEHEANNSFLTRGDIYKNTIKSILKKFDEEIPKEWLKRNFNTVTINANAINSSLINSINSGYAKKLNDDLSNLATSLCSVTTTMHNDSKNIKEEKIMNKVLEIYKNKERHRISEKYELMGKEIIAKDTLQSIIKELQEQIKSIAGEKADAYCFEYRGLYEDETKEALKTMEKQKDDELNSLYKKIEEIEALLELAPNYEEKMKILRDYDIIDKKKNIIL